MKNILVTGALRGLGKHIKDHLLSKGYYVYGTTRDLSNVKPEKNTKYFFLDLCDKKSITDVVSYFQETGEPLAGIIHNAGIAYLDPIEILEEEEYREIFEVNFFGPIALTKQLLPNLKKSPRSNLIFISSIVCIDCWPYLGAYAASKRALESAAFEWASLLKSWNIRVSVIQPNPLPTDMNILRSKNAPHSHYPELENRDLKWEDIQETTKLITNILEADHPKFQYQTGKHSRQTFEKFLNKTAYQECLEEYQSKFMRVIKNTNQ